MSRNIRKTDNEHTSPFEQIKRVNDAGQEFWSSREFAEVLGYGDYRNFEAVVEKAKIACFNSAHPVDDHFVDVTEMVMIGSGAERPVKPKFPSQKPHNLLICDKIQRFCVFCTHVNYVKAFVL